MRGVQRAQQEPRGLQQATPPPLVLVPLGIGDGRFPRYVPRFRSHHQLLPERPLASWRPGCLLPLFAQSPVAFAILWRPLLHSQEEPVGDGRMSMEMTRCVAGVPASTTRTTVGGGKDSTRCLTSIPPSTTIESLRWYRAVAKVLTERATRHDAACPPQAGMAQRVQCHSGSSMAPSSRPHVGGQQVQTRRCRELQRTRARRCRLEETTNTVQ